MTARIATPQSVSAALRRGGLLPTPRDREGIHVTRDLGGACVSIDVDSRRREAELIGEVVEILTSAGYVVTPNPFSASLFTVTR